MVRDPASRKFAWLIRPSVTLLARALISSQPTETETTGTTVAVLDPVDKSALVNSKPSYFKTFLWSMLLVIPAIAMGVYGQSWVRFPFAAARLTKSIAPAFPVYVARYPAAGYQYQVMTIEEQFWWVWHRAHAPPIPPRYIAGTIRERWGSNGGFYGEFPI